jgi:hypothetical protein
MHFILELIQIRQTGSDDQPPERMTNKSQASEIISRTTLSHVLVHFLSKFIPHVDNTAVSVVFIGSRAQKLGFRESYGYNIFKHSHVE